MLPILEKELTVANKVSKFVGVGLSVSHFVKLEVPQRQVVLVTPYTVVMSESRQVSVSITIPHCFVVNERHVWRKILTKSVKQIYSCE